MLVTPQHQRFNTPISRFWLLWLTIVCVGVIAFGALLVLLPTYTRQGFSLLVYASTERIDSFGVESARYSSLAHAVIGGTIVGWGCALLYVTRGLVAKGSQMGWNIIALSVVAWFLSDTGYSLVSGYWQNAVLNMIFLLLFLVPMLALRSSMKNTI